MEMPLTEISQDFIKLNHDQLPNTITNENGESDQNPREASVGPQKRSMTLRASQKAARIASGGRQVRMASIRLAPISHVSKAREKAQYLWSVVREAILEKRITMSTGILLKETTNIPYKTLIQQGFHFRNSIKHDQTVLLTYHHLAHSQRHGDAAGSKHKSSLDSKDADVDLSTMDLVGNPLSNNPKVKPYTIVTVDRLRRISFWEVNAKGVSHHISTVKMENEVKELVLVSRLSIYAACFIDSIIKVILEHRFIFVVLYHGDGAHQRVSCSVSCTNVRFPFTDSPSKAPI